MRKIVVFVLFFLISALLLEAQTVGELFGLAQLKSSLCLSWPAQPNCTNGAGGLTCTNNRVTGISISRAIQTNPCSNRIIPDIWREFSSLTSLHIDSADSPYQITGTLPISLYSLSSITSLRINRGSLTGSISEAIQNLTQLITLSLAENRLTGPLPTSIGKLTPLMQRDLIGN
jgi:hypothetical protein